MKSVAEVAQGEVTQGVVVREEFGATEIHRAAETSALALAEREKATIAAMFLVADGRRRSIPQFEIGLLAECERPGFAEIARYKKPQRHRDPDTGEWVDGFIEGWSIRFAEAALRNWKNVFCDAKIVFEDDQKRIVRFMLIDLESNLPLSTEIQLSKTVERRGTGRGGDQPPKGRDILGERVNVAGQKVFIVAATDDELYMKQASAFSKFRRNALTFVPGDVLDAALTQVHKTLKGQSPEAARTRMITGFDQIGVTIADLQAYLGHSISQITDEEVAELRGIYAAIKTEESTWASVMERKAPTGSTQSAAEVAKQKIDTLSKKSSTTAQPDDKGGSSPSAPAETSAQTGAPTPEASGKPSEPPADPTILEDLMKLREQVGGLAWADIIKKHGGAVATDADLAAITDDQFSKMLPDFDEAIRLKNAEPPKKQGRLKI